MIEKIIKNASELFLKVGFKSVTMDDIAYEMGISKKTIYKYFGNKEVLIEAISEAHHAEAHHAIDEVLVKNYNAIAENFEIRKMLNKMFDVSATSPIYQLKKYYPQIYEQIVSRETNQRDVFLKQNIEKGIAQGLYRENINIENYVQFYFTLIFGIKGATSLETEGKKLELDALEYHIRAMATPKGIEELEKQLLNINN